MNVEAEELVSREGELKAGGNLVSYLFLGAENVGIVLREVAHAEKAVERSA